MSTDCIGIKGVAEAVADMVDRHCCDEDHETGKNHQPWRSQSIDLGVGKLVPPTGCGWLHAESKVTETRFDDDGISDQQRTLDDDNTNAIGQDMATDNAQVSNAEGGRCQHKISALKLQKFSSHQSARPHPGQHGDDYDNDDNAISQWQGGHIPQHGADKDQDKETGQTEKSVCDAHQDVIDVTTEITTRGADQDPDSPELCGVSGTVPSAW